MVIAVFPVSNFTLIYIRDEIKQLTKFPTVSLAITCRAFKGATLAVDQRNKHIEIIFEEKSPYFFDERTAFRSSTVDNEPTTTQRCRSETQKFILEDLFSSVLSQF